MLNEFKVSVEISAPVEKVWEELVDWLGVESGFPPQRHDDHSLLAAEQVVTDAQL